MTFTEASKQLGSSSASSGTPHGAPHVWLRLRTLGAVKTQTPAMWHRERPLPQKKSTATLPLHSNSSRATTALRSSRRAESRSADRPNDGSLGRRLVGAELGEVASASFTFFSSSSSSSFFSSALRSSRCFCGGPRRRWPGCPLRPSQHQAFRSHKMRQLAFRPSGLQAFSSS